MRLKLIILGTTAASLFGIALAIPFFIDLSSYKTEFSARASKIIGHPVKIDGDISLSLLPTPHIAIEKISAPNLLRLKQINLNLDFWPLLTKKAVIHSITLIKPDLQFQKLAHDPLNLGLPLEKIIIQEGRLTYASKGQKTRFKDIDLTFDVKKNQATGSFVFLEKEIRFNVSKSTLELSIDKIFLRTSGKLIFTEHSLRFGNNLSIDWQHAFKIEGNFKNLPQKTELNFIANQNNSTWNGNINLNSANSGDFLRDFGMENLPKVYFRPVQLVTHFSYGQTLRLQNLSLTSDKMHLQGSLVLAGTPQQFSVKELHAKLGSALTLEGFANIDLSKDTPLINATLNTSALNFEINLNILKEFNGQFEITAPQITSKTLVLANPRISAQVQDGTLTLHPLAALINDGEFLLNTTIAKDHISAKLKDTTTHEFEIFCKNNIGEIKSQTSMSTVAEEIASALAEICSQQGSNL